MFDTFLYEPLVNLLAVFVSFSPNGDMGLAIILLTILVKIVLLPLSKKQIVSQAKMNLLTPEINKINASGASKEEKARLTFELYRKHKTSPFSGCLVFLVQFPIIIALYYVFFKGLNFDGDVLYSFVKAPEVINTQFLGFLDLAGKSVILAILAGASQYLQAIYMPQPAINTSGSDFQKSLQSSMQVQMKYFFPFLIAFISYTISGAIALYFTVSNLFAVAQQIYLGKKKISMVVHGEVVETKTIK